MVKVIVWIVFLILTIFIPVSVITSLITLLLWNALMPAIFGIATITFGQAYILAIIFIILFRARAGVTYRGNRREWD